MGYLTTFTVRNDGVDLIKKHPEDFAEKVYKAAVSGDTGYFGLSYFANVVDYQRFRHADDHTTYVHMGNCLTEVNPYSPDFENLVRRNPDFAKKLVKFMEGEVKAAKRVIKSIEAEGKTAQ